MSEQNKKTINLTLQLVLTQEMFETLIPILAQASVTKPEPVPEFITLKEAEVMSPYKYQTIRKWIVIDNAIPFSRRGPGGRIVIEKSAFESLLSGKINNSNMNNEVEKKKTDKREPGRPRREPITFI